MADNVSMARRFQKGLDDVSSAVVGLTEQGMSGESKITTEVKEFQFLLSKKLKKKVTRRLEKAATIKANKIKN